jgi:hypothetical protein
MRSVRDKRPAMRPGPISWQPGADPLLERSEQLAALTADLETVSASGQGRLVLIGGEAGIGKSALVDTFCAGLTAPVLRGACEALLTPRPLGPLADIAEQVGGELGGLVDAGTTPSDLVAALARLLRRRPQTVVVLEDRRPSRLRDPHEARRQHSHGGGCRGESARDHVKIGSPPHVAGFAEP